MRNVGLKPMKYTHAILLATILHIPSCAKEQKPARPVFPKEGTVIDSPGLIVFQYPEFRSKELTHVLFGRSVIVDEKKENSEIVTMSGSRAWYRIRKPAGWIFGHEPVPEKDFEKTKQYLLLCEIGTRPFRFAPMWVDNGRIVAPLSQTKGPPMQTTSQVRPHPYIEKQIVQDNNYSYPDAVFHTSFVPHISKDLLRSVDISDPAFPQIQELEGLTPDKLRNLFSEIGSKDSKLIQFNGCSGNRFRDVQGSIAFEFDGDTLKLLRISYPEE
jgi:hypothetical protein